MKHMEKNKHFFKYLGFARTDSLLLILYDSHYGYWLYGTYTERSIKYEPPEQFPSFVHFFSIEPLFNLVRRFRNNS